MSMPASVNILMSSIHKRWLTRREILMVQGIPSTTAHTFGVPCSSFAARSTGHTTRPWPSRRGVCSMSGNSMHTSVSGCCMLFAITQVSFDPNMMKLQRYMLARSLRLEPTPATTKVARAENADADDLDEPKLKKLKPL